VLSLISTFAVPIRFTVLVRPRRAADRSTERF
jgi:hypothetical protein